MADNSYHQEWEMQADEYACSRGYGRDMLKYLCEIADEMIKNFCIFTEDYQRVSGRIDNINRVLQQKERNNVVLHQIGAVQARAGL